MSVDAFVFCDCYEKRKLKEPPPRPELVSLDNDGWLSCEGLREDPALFEEFEEWITDRACEHRKCTLAYHRVGNISEVDTIYSEIRRAEELFPIILGKAVYNGMHSGDIIAGRDLINLRIELELMKEFTVGDPDNEWSVEDFRDGMTELAESALSIGHPIAFK